MAEQELHHPKIVDLPELLERLDSCRAGRSVVFTNGCYDMLHPGHVDLLARARSLGDMLVLGLNSDASVRALRKGRGRPVNTAMDRAFVLAHLESVDCIVFFDEETPLALIQAIVPDVLVKGGDWTPDRIVGREVVERAGGQVLSLKLLAGYSTTGVLERIHTRDIR